MGMERDDLDPRSAQEIFDAMMVGASLIGHYDDRTPMTMTRGAGSSCAEDLITRAFGEDVRTGEA